MSPVRELCLSDIPFVADLSWNFLRRREGAAPPAFRNYFESLFLQNPWFDKSLPSLVFEDDNHAIVGFLGVIPRAMTLRGQPVRATFGSNLVVHPDSRSTLAGLHLMKTYLAGSQDLSIADYANDLTVQVQRSFGAKVIPLDSIHWSRVLRPAQYGLDAFSRLKKGSWTSVAKSLGKPFCKLADRLAESSSSSPFHLPTPRLRGQELSVEVMLERFDTFTSQYSLRPVYSLQSLTWLLEFMRKMKAFGEVYGAVLRDDRDEIVGWYIYYLKADGAVGEVVQVMSSPRAGRDVLAHLFHDAHNRGAVGLHGRLDPRWLEDLSEMGCFFYRRGSWVQIHSRRPEFSQLFQTGDALLTRLDGEWCLSF